MKPSDRIRAQLAATDGLPTAWTRADVEGLLEELAASEARSAALAAGIEEAVSALEDIAEGNAQCTDPIGYGCRQECRRAAFKPLDRLRALLAATPAEAYSAKFDPEAP